MSRLCLTVSLLAMLGAATTAFAMDKPTVDTPKSGDALGPSYDIHGSMPYRALLVVMTDCVRTDTGELVGSVPGIRHWTKNNGRFQFRCASPRVFLGPDVPLVYRIRCYEVNKAGEKGPAAVVECRKDSQ